MLKIPIFQKKKRRSKRGLNQAWMNGLVAWHPWFWLWRGEERGRRSSGVVYGHVERPARCCSGPAADLDLGQVIAWFWFCCHHGGCARRGQRHSHTARHGTARHMRETSSLLAPSLLQPLVGSQLLVVASSPDLPSTSGPAGVHHGHSHSPCISLSPSPGTSSWLLHCNTRSRPGRQAYMTRPSATALESVNLIWDPTYCMKLSCTYTYG